MYKDTAFCLLLESLKISNGLMDTATKTGIDQRLLLKELYKRLQSLQET